MAALGVQWFVRALILCVASRWRWPWSGKSLNLERLGLVGTSFVPQSRGLIMAGVDPSLRLVRGFAQWIELSVSDSFTESDRSV